MYIVNIHVNYLCYRPVEIGQLVLSKTTVLSTVTYNIFSFEGWRERETDDSAKGGNLFSGKPVCKVGVVSLLFATRDFVHPSVSILLVCLTL